MSRANVVGIVCEDIREEKSGTETLVGIMPDNLSIPSVPALLPKMGFYTRVHVPLESSLSLISMKVSLLDGSMLDLGSFDVAAIEREKAIVKDKGGAFVGFIFRGIFSPMPVPKFGRINVWAKLDEEEFICASINFEQATDNSPAPVPPG